MEEFGDASGVGESAAVDLPGVSAVDPDLRISVTEAQSQTPQTINGKNGESGDGSQDVSVQLFHAASESQIPNLHKPIISDHNQVFVHHLNRPDVLLSMAKTVLG